MDRSGPPRRYLDNAATSWPKPESVLAAWTNAARDVGAAAGRGGHAAAIAADSIRSRARLRAAALLGGVDPARVALPSGATLGLNMAIHGLVRPGDHAIATAADHNATLRPLEHLRRSNVIDLTIVPCDGLGRVDPAAIAAAWRPATRFVVFSHASNVTGALQDATAIAAIAHERGGLVVLDASQSLGQVANGGGHPPAWGADVVVAPAHKWLHGMAGVAILWARAGVEIEPLVQGGTGSASDSLAMPTEFADRLEAGTPDLPALAALDAAATWLETETVAALRERCGTLAAACAARLREIRGARVFAALEGGPPIVSFTLQGYDPGELAALLEQAAGVQARSGFHCAACVHEWLGTQAGGTVRLAFGPFNTAADVDAVVAAVEQFAT
ncbi:MAG: aminotransferase class V-fold PLP-dependent enzyme [Planctomycetia bacterium]